MDERTLSNAAMSFIRQPFSYLLAGFDYLLIALCLWFGFVVLWVAVREYPNLKDKTEHGWALAMAFAATSSLVAARFVWWMHTHP